MLWWHRHGKHLKSYEELEAAGKARVKSLDDRPAVFPGNEWLFDAFMSLDTCRMVGMEAGPIPWTAADAYARRLRMDDDGMALLWGVIHRADTAYRAELRKEKG